MQVNKHFSTFFSEIVPTQFVTRPKPICLFGSTDSECKKVTTGILTLKPEPSTTKMPTTRQSYITTSRKIPITTIAERPKISTFATKTTLSQVKCYPGMNLFSIFIFDRYWVLFSKRSSRLIGSLDPRCATDILNCDRNPSDIRCNQVIVPLRCGPGFPYDARCKKLVTTQIPSTYSPTSAYSTFGTYPTTERRETTSRISIKPETTFPNIYSKAPICYPGALDPRCLSLTTKKIFPPSPNPVITTTEPNLIISTTEAEPECLPGMLNNIMNQNILDSFIGKSKFPGSSDVQCKKLVATQVPSTSSPYNTSAYSTYTTYPATERRETTNRISFEPETTTPKMYTKAPICYPGALDPRCRSTITTERIISSSETPISTTSFSEVSKGRCYPGKNWVPQCHSNKLKIFFSNRFIRSIM